MQAPPPEDLHGIREGGGGIPGRLGTVPPDPEAGQFGRERLALPEGADGREDAAGGTYTRE